MSYSLVHSHGESSPDGVCSAKDWVDMAKNKGLYGLALTDHGIMTSALELYYEGKKQKFPIALGEEFYVVNSADPKSYYHLTVWCKNEIGYKNLCILSSLAFSEENFYSKPRITNELLFEHKEGLIIGSGCFIGELGQKLLKGETDSAREYAIKMKEEFGDDFYIEIMPALVKNSSKEQVRYPQYEKDINLQIPQNEMLLNLAHELKIKHVCSSDAHMPDTSYKTVQRVKMYNKSKTWEYDYLYYMHGFEEFKKQWVDEFGLDHEQFLIGCKNSNEIIDKCKDLNLKFEWKLPEINYSLYPVERKSNQKELLISLIEYHGKIPNNKTYLERLSREVKLLSDNGVHNFIDYFLFLEDVCRYCNNVGIMVGISRGSVGGSLLAYALNITDIDPIKYNLTFERFINTARINQGTLPDIDLDIESRRRPEVLEYICNTYGKDHVASFGTVHTMKIKSALKDTIRILDPELPQDRIDALCASIPWVESDKNESKEEIESIIEKAPLLRKYLSEHKEIRDTIMASMGQMRQYGVHAAAIAVSPNPIREFVPLARKSKDTMYYTQYSMDYCAKAGLVKYDILGLNTLSDIATCLDLIHERTGKRINPWRDIPLDDKDTMEAFQKGRTVTVFQFNTEIFSDLLRTSKVETLDDLVALNTLGRPGTYDTGMHKEWISRRKGQKSVSHIHESLKPVLKDTYGILLYQEQVMSAVQVLAGFTLEEADDIRSAIGKKKTEVIDKYKLIYLERVPQCHPDISKDKAEKIWDLIEAFGRYSFNYAHAVAYSIVAYICQYLKTHYVLEWWCAILRNEKEDDRRRYYYQFIKKLIAPYSVNKCRTEYYIDGKFIIPPIDSIKFIGKESAKQIIERGPFSNFDDFYTKVDKVALKKHVVINMILGGLFADIEPDRNEQQLIEHFYKTYFGAKLKSNGMPNAEWREWESEFKSIGPADLQKRKMEILPHNSISLNKLYKGEDYSEVLSYSEVKSMSNRDPVKLVGVVLSIHHTKTKKDGKSMFFTELSNEGESISLTVFPEKAIKLRDIFRKGNVLKVDGEINTWGGKFGVVVSDAIEIDKMNNGATK